MITQNKLIIRTCDLIPTPNPVRTCALGAVDEDIDSVAVLRLKRGLLGSGETGAPHHIPLYALHGKAGDGDTGSGLATGRRIRLIDYDAEVLVSPQSMGSEREGERERDGR